MKTFGLIGKNISYSFSRSFFSKKFENEHIDARYENFDIPSISEFPDILKQNPSISGFNVTIPYKESIMSFLDEIDETAKEIGAVNTIKVTSEGKLIGFNTDFYGFTEALKVHLKAHHKKALILGTGGASKAVAFALKELGISYTYVSRTKQENNLTYSEITKETINNYQLIINCTPLGTFPNIEEFPSIPTHYLNENHLVFDLIYNPPHTKLLKLALDQHAEITNGLRMLELQAEKAWEIWTK